MEQIVFIEWDILSSSITNENLILLVLSIINTALFVSWLDWIILKCLETECVWSHTIIFIINYQSSFSYLPKGNEGVKPKVELMNSKCDLSVSVDIASGIV